MQLHILLTGILFSLSGLSQLFAEPTPPTTAGKDFWVSYATINNIGYSTTDLGYINNISLQLKIVALEDVTVTLHFTANAAATANIQVKAGEVYTYDFKARGTDQWVYPTALGDESRINNNSLHITSTGDISVYSLAHNLRMDDATCLIPTSNLGMEYYDISYVTDGSRSDYFLAIATQDGTEIYEDANPTPVTTLSKGQLWERRLGTGVKHFTGTHVTSNKPIAFFVANGGAAVPSGSTWMNNLYQQLPPVWEWGLEFFVPVTDSNKDRVRVMVSQDGTEISFDGLIKITDQEGQTATSGLLAGQWVDFEIGPTGGGYISSNKPVGVCSFMPSNTYVGGSYKGSPSMCWIPPIKQTIKWSIVAPFVPNTSPVASTLSAHHAIIIVKAGTENETYYAKGTDNPVRFNTLVPTPAWRSYNFGGDAKYSYCDFDLKDANTSYYFGNEDGLLVLSYGATASDYTGTEANESYYYPSGMAVRNLYPSFYVNDIHYQDLDWSTFCGVTDFKFELRTVTDHNPTNYLIWNVWKVNSATDSTLLYTVNDINPWTQSLTQGRYTATMTYADQLHPFPDPYVLETHFWVKEHTAAADNIIARDTTICSGSVNLSSLVESTGIDDPVKFRWYYSESGVLQLTDPPVVSPTTTTEYWVSVEGGNYCEGVPNSTGRKKVTVNVTTQQSYLGLVTGPADLSLCGSSSVNATLTATCSPLVDTPVFYWYSSQTASSPVYTGATYTFSAPYGNTTLYVSVQGANYCDGGTSARKPVTVTVSVAPVYLVWTPEANTGSDKQNWNNPANWTPNEVPTPCSHVFIPGKCVYYPVLETTTAAVCDSIFFMQGAELARPDLLTYNRAFVQYNLGLSQTTQITNEDNANLLRSTTADRMKYSASASANPIQRERWYMLSSPLRGVVTGDLSFGGFPLTFLMKFGPVEKDGTNYGIGKWTTPYTGMNVPLKATEGFAFYVYGFQSGGTAERNLGCYETGIYGTLGEFPHLPLTRDLEPYGLMEMNGILELPFFEDNEAIHAHRTQVYESATRESKFYLIDDGSYIPANHNRLYGGEYEATTRDPNSGNYRFIPETYNSVSGKWEFQPQINHSGEGLGGEDDFMVGNPYMSSLNMVSFLGDNTATLQQNFKIWNGSGFLTYYRQGSLIYDAASGGNVADSLIAPLQGFFLTTLSGYVYNSVTNPNVATFDVTTVSTTRPGGMTNLRSSGAPENRLRIQAENGSAESFMLIGYDGNAGAGFKENTDVRKLFSPYGYVPEIYALAGETPADIRFINNNNKEIIVPIGIRTEQKGEIRLTFSGMDNYGKASKIELFDAKENRTVDLTGKTSYTYAFNNAEIGIQNGRFSLRFDRSPTSIQDVNVSDNLRVYSDSKGIYVISPSSDPVQKLEIYDFQGRKLYESASGASYYPLQDSFGHLPMIVKVVTANRVTSYRLQVTIKIANQ